MLNLWPFVPPARGRGGSAPVPSWHDASGPWIGVTLWHSRNRVPRGGRSRLAMGTPAQRGGNRGGSKWPNSAVSAVRRGLERSLRHHGVESSGSDPTRTTVPGGDHELASPAASECDDRDGDRSAVVRRRVDRGSAAPQKSRWRSPRRRVEPPGCSSGHASGYASEHPPGVASRHTPREAVSELPGADPLDDTPEPLVHAEALGDPSTDVHRPLVHALAPHVPCADDARSVRFGRTPVDVRPPFRIEVDVRSPDPWSFDRSRGEHPQADVAVAGHRRAPGAGESNQGSHPVAARTPR